MDVVIRRSLGTLAVTAVLSLALLAPVAAQPRPITLIRDAETERLLRTINTPLFAAAGLDRGLVRTYILSDRSINAFVTTGNRLVVHTGLITSVGSANELAGVLAHEVGHISGGHIARLPEELRNAMIRSVAAMLVGAAAAAATGQSGAAAAIGVGGQSLAMRELFAFTRTQENAADQAAVTYLARVGWSHAGLLRVMERLSAQEMLLTENQDPYLRTHPLTRDRMEFLRERLEGAAAAQAPMPAEIEQSFQMVRAKLIGFLDGAAVARVYPAADRSAPARYARAILAYRQGRTDEAIAGLDALIAERPASPWLHELRGQVLHESGRVREALDSYRQAARLAPGEGLIRAGLGRVMVDTGDPAMLPAAIAELESSTRLDPRTPLTWRTLGIAHGRAGDLGRSALALAEEAALLGDLRTQREMAARAERLLPPGPARLRAQDLSRAAEVLREERRR
ncbi:MAG: M48 family metalloprotease [Acetobacteraceae bacterium]